MLTSQIIRNTYLLYVRQILIAMVGVLSLRLTLGALGVTDYGLYNAIYGIAGITAFIPGALTSVTQRFFSFELGKGDMKKLKEMFSINLTIYAFSTLICLIMLESMGYYFVTNFLYIPQGKEEIARLLYHFVVASAAINILNTPFIAIIVAHEDMKIFAYTSLFEAMTKLSVVLLVFLVEQDRILLYGILTCVTSVLTISMYVYICRSRYDECRALVLRVERKTLRSVLSYTGWSLLGQLTAILRINGTTILLNQFYGPSTVAARVLSLSISTQTNMFASNFNTSIYPPIIKAYASGEKKRMVGIVIQGSKLTFYLMLLFSLPLFLEMDGILKLWLTLMPGDVVLFTRLALIETLITALALPLMTAVRATGNVRNYEIVMSAIQAATFVASCVVAYLEKDAYFIYVISIISVVVSFVVRLWLIRQIMSFPVRQYMNMIIVYIIAGSASVGAICVSVQVLMLNLGLSIFVRVSVLLLLVMGALYILGLSADLRNQVRKALISRIYRYLSRVF